MKRAVVFVVVTLQVALAQTGPAPKDLPPCPTEVDTPDVAALLQRTERLLEGRTSIAVLQMAIKTPAWERSLKMKIWSKGRDFALVRIMAGGPRETGMMTLKRERQLWNYLPQAGRVMKLPSSMLGDSWMGSDFTNDDLVRGSSLVADFSSKVERTVDVGGRAAWFITLVPKATAKTVWGKVEFVLDRATCVPLEQRFFDEEGALARKMTFEGVKQVGWRAFPTKVSVVPEESGRQTTMVYESIEFDVDIPEETFSLRRLQQSRD
jgi:Outer membrane lipoprotein-sorting protein